MQQAVKTALLQRFAIEEVDEQVKEDFIATFETLAYDVTIDYIVSQLDNASVKTFISYLEQDATGEKALAFAREKISSLDSKLSKRIEEEIKQLQMLA